MKLRLNAFFWEIHCYKQIQFNTCDKMFLSESICLQFTSSGYNRAKSMLDAKFGGSTKVDKVHIMAIKNIWCQSSKCSRVL